MLLVANTIVRKWLTQNNIILVLLHHPRSGVLVITTIHNITKIRTLYSPVTTKHNIVHLDNSILLYYVIARFGMKEGEKDKKMYIRENVR